MTKELILTGLDGSNPLAFFAALGVLAAVTEHAKQFHLLPPKLSWRDEGRWHPVLQGTGEKEQLLALLLHDRSSWSSEPVLGLSYKKEGKETTDNKKVVIANDLKPSPQVYRDFLKGLLSACTPEARRSVDYVACFATETARDHKGNVKPTALHFTAGQQELLKAVKELLQGLSREHFIEALFGPWKYQSPLPGLGWDATASRDYAYRASDPSKEKKLGVAGADWLAFRGLKFFPVAPIKSRIETTGCTGEWKTGKFTWPLWDVPLTEYATKSLVGLPRVEKLPSEERGARGIAQVFCSQIRRSEQGGYGSFLPAEVVKPQ
jgi:hypothetical protein